MFLISRIDPVFIQEITSFNYSINYENYYSNWKHFKKFNGD